MMAYATMKVTVGLVTVEQLCEQLSVMRYAGYGRCLTKFTLNGGEILSVTAEKTLDAPPPAKENPAKATPAKSTAKG